jgi:hypothetical protein
MQSPDEAARVIEVLGKLQRQFLSGAGGPQVQKFMSKVPEFSKQLLG